MRLLLILSYLGLLAWQPIWHALLPEPLGMQITWLGAVAAVPLLFPLKGVLTDKHSSRVWAAYLLVFYFLAGVMEAWSNPAQRPAATVQIVLVCSYFLALSLLNRGRSKPAD